MSLEARVGGRVGELVLEADVEVPSGETVVLLGPNGAGKTTLLRMLAGLTAAREARVELDGDVLEDTASRRFVPPEHRSVGFVFQDYLLFPHLSALDNIAFGMRRHGRDRRSARRDAGEWLERMGIAGSAHLKPQALSGGQAQRVALARALATEPRLLLLDEPLAALDAVARVEVRRSLKASLGDFDGTRLLVTHDPLEAMALGDRLVIFESGHVVQRGTPAEVRARPRSSYAANLVGMNLFEGTARRGVVTLAGGGSLVASSQIDGAVLASIHPRAVSLFSTLPEGSPRNVWSLTVASVEPGTTASRVALTGAVTLVAEVTEPARAELGLAEGRQIYASVKATEIEVYPT